MNYKVTPEEASRACERFEELSQKNKYPYSEEDMKTVLEEFLKPRLDKFKIAFEAVSNKRNELHDNAMFSADSCYANGFEAALDMIESALKGGK